MQLVQEGMNDEEAIEKAAINLEFDQKLTGGEHDKQLHVSAQ